MTNAHKDITKTHNKASKIACDTSKQEPNSRHKNMHAVKDSLHEKGEEKLTVLGHTLTRADLFKFASLVVFFIIMCIVCVFLYPMLKDFFEPGGINRVTSNIKEAGLAGVGTLLALQFLQMVIAFIPGEVTQIAAGLIYGPWWGAFIIALGCVISTAFIYELVNKLGAPFARAFVPEKALKQIIKLEKSPQFSLIVFILFLIPGLPKDVFTYIVPLTSMPLSRFLVLTTLGRLPGIVLSTYAAAGFSHGSWFESIAIFVVLGVLALIALVFGKQIMTSLEKTIKK